MATNLPATPVPAGLDPRAYVLTKAIGYQENGGKTPDYNAVGDNGTSKGAYQWQAATWKAHAAQVLGDANAPMTPENQNKVAYTIVKSRLDAGLTPAQVTSEWNSGDKNAYLNPNQKNGNTPQYVANVQKYAEQFFNQMGAQPSQPGGIIPTANAETPGAQPQSSPSVSGFVQNAFNSAGGLISGLGQAVMHPIDTLSNVAGMAAGGVEKALGVQPNEDTQKFDQLTSYLKQRYGGDSISQVMGHIANTAYTDPVGMALDLSTVVDGVGAAVGAVGKTAKIAELSKAADLLKQASETINPIAQGAKVARPIVNTGIAATRSIASHLFSLSDPASITTVLENTPEFSKGAIEANSRASLAEEFGSALDQLHNSVQEGGRAYGGVAAQPGVITAPENWIADVLKNGSSVAEDGSKAIPFKINLTEDVAKPGRQIVSADTTSFTRDPREIAAIQNFVDMWGNKTQFTPQEFLNMRSDLSKMSKFGRDVGKNDAAEIISRALRADANKTMRPQINGLKQLDETQAPLIKQYNQAKKDFLTIGQNGVEFKPGAINKIANAAGKGKDLLLQRMEQIMPGITKRIQILKAIEDWESASKAKVGTYARGILEGGGLITGSIPAIAGAIISNPAIALPLLRGLGWSAAKMKPLIDMLRKVVNVNTLKYPTEMGATTSKANQQNPPASPPQKESKPQ